MINLYDAFKPSSAFALQALDLCKRLGEVAEQEKHHPDLHITVSLSRKCLMPSVQQHLHSHVCIEKKREAPVFWRHKHMFAPTILMQQGWNQVSVDVWTHARDGLTENDFILAAKLNKVPKEDLLKKPKKKMNDTY